MSLTLYRGDALETLRGLPDVADCVVTSPPYWKTRRYTVHDRELGREATPDEYVLAIADYMDGVRVALRDDGVLWLDLGDSYHRGEQQLIPERIGLELRNHGWVIRAKVIWHKVNVVPPNARRHPGLDYETVLMLTGPGDYHYDPEVVKVPAKWERWGRQTVTKYEGTDTASGWMPERSREEVQAIGNGLRHLRQVWRIPTSNYAGNHTAVFPEALVEPCIKSSCPPGGTVLDCFLGSGTTAVVASKLGRNCIGIELSPDNCTLAASRTTLD